MTDRERLLEILNYDMESYIEEAENITEEEAKYIKSAGVNYVIPNSSHPENLTLRNNMILTAIGNHKGKNNFALKSIQLLILFADHKKAEMTCDMNEAARAYAFSTTVDNVIMYDVLRENINRVLTENKTRVK